MSEGDRSTRPPEPEDGESRLYRGRDIIQQLGSPEAEAAIRAFAREGVRKVLDLGCGVGRYSRLLVEQGFEVHGCDLSEDAVNIARVRVPEATFRRSKTNELPYDAGEFEAVFCHIAIRSGGQIRLRALPPEIRRVLKPGGVLFLVVASKEPAAGRPGTPAPATLSREEIEKLFGDFETLALEHRSHDRDRDTRHPATSWTLLARLPRAS